MLEVRTPDTPSAVDFHPPSHATLQPEWTVDYVQNAGLLRHLAYESTDAGRAGTGHVCLCNGNLVYTRSLSRGNGSRMPFSLDLAYNSSFPQVGWRPRCEASLSQNGARYVLVQGDGSRHDFEKPTPSAAYYEDTSGLALQLTESPTSLQITSKEGAVLTFPPLSNGAASNSKLASLRDSNGAQIQFFYDAENGRLLYVLDGAARITSLQYLGNHLTSVIAPGETNAVQLAYDAAGRMTSVTDADGVQTDYGYDERDRLLYAQDAYGHRVTYTYTAAPYRVAQVRATGGTTAGNARGYTYLDGTTVAQDLTHTDGKCIHYTFNDRGNVVCARDALGFVTLTTYDAAIPNHPILQSQPQRATVADSLPNGRFSETETFTLETLDGAQGTYLLDARIPFQGSPMLSIHKTSDVGRLFLHFRTVPAMVAHPYTFSAYVRTENAARCRLLISIPKADGTIYRRQSTPRATANCEWQRIEIACSFPADAQATNGMAQVGLEMEVTGGQGTAMFCLLQWEQGASASRYNYLSNSSFAQTRDNLPLYWTANPANTLDDHVHVDAEEKPLPLPSSALRLHGAPGVAKGMYQELAVSGGSGDVFVLGGWAWGQSQPLAGEAKRFGLRVAFFGTIGSMYPFPAQDPCWRDGGACSFLSHWDGWQYVSTTATAVGPYTKVRFFIDYEDN
ncbi:MAG: hypothetical protein RR482_05605, partial [Clostridia bacterium]